MEAGARRNEDALAAVEPAGDRDARVGDLAGGDVAADHLVILTDDIDVILPALALDGRFGTQRRLVRARADPRRGEDAGPQRGSVAERDARAPMARLRIASRRNLPDLALALLVGPQRRHRRGPTPREQHQIRFGERDRTDSV